MALDTQDPGLSRSAEGLWDIAPPPVPEPLVSGDVVLAAAAIIAAVVIGLIVRRYLRRPRRIARRRLAALRREAGSGRVTAREAAYRTGAILREALEVRHLDAEAITASGDPAPWRALIVTLDRARYSREGCGGGELDRLLAEAGRLLEAGP